MMIRYYDRQGSPINLEKWGELLENREYQRVAETTLEDGTWISTVWLGLDHSFNDASIKIFETMIFPSRDNLSEIAMDRYSTESEALEGHKKMVEDYRRGVYTAGSTFTAILLTVIIPIVFWLTA